SGQVGVLLPVTQGLPEERPSLGRTGVEELAQRPQVGLEPVAGLTAVLRLRRVVEFGGVNPLAGASERGVTGGVVAVAGLQVVGQLGVAGEDVGGQTRGGSVELLDLADTDQG